MLCLHVCLYTMCFIYALVSTVRREHWILRNCYRWLWASNWMQEITHRFFARAGRALNTEPFLQLLAIQFSTQKEKMSSKHWSKENEERKWKWCSYILISKTKINKGLCLFPYWFRCHVIDFNYVLIYVHSFPFFCFITLTVLLSEYKLIWYPLFFPNIETWYH